MTGPVVEQFRVREPLPPVATRRDRDLFAWWTAEDQQQTRELADGIRGAKREQAELEKKIRDTKFRLSKAAQLQAEADERELKAALGELPKGYAVPVVESSSRLDQLLMAKLEEKLQEAKDNEVEFSKRLSAHRLASNRRAAIAVYREKYEPAAKQLDEARALLMGAHVDAEEAGAGDIVHVPLFIQCVIPCEPGLAAHPREYTKAFMAEWWVHGKADASARWHSISLKARADFLSLVGSDITVNWKRPK